MRKVQVTPQEQNGDKIDPNFDPNIENSSNERLCGVGPCRPKWLQKFASTKTFIFVYSLLALVQGMSWSYFSATITTLEKRFKISSQTAGIVMTGNEISQILFSILLSYLGGKVHRPKWIFFGVLASALSFFVVASPHLFYGSGHDSLKLTLEYQDSFEDNLNGSPTGGKSIMNLSSSIQKNKKIQLCNISGNSTRHGSGCGDGETTIIPLILIFSSQFISGIGVLLFYSLGGTYLDDNLTKTKTPFMFGISMSARLLGPLAGYSFAAVCLKIFINPTLTPVITTEDHRWIGAWWIGWLVLGVLMTAVSFLMLLFPKELPRASVRRKMASMMDVSDDFQTQTSVISSRVSMVETFDNNLKENQVENDSKRNQDEELPKISDLPRTVKNILFKNKVNLYNNLAAVFYLFSAIGYWTYMPKYFETMFMQTAVNASVYSGGVSIVSQGAGLLISGALISKIMPSARKLALWNVLVGLFSVAILVSFTQLGCSKGNLNLPDSDNVTSACNSGCECELSKIQPVCHTQTSELFISPCHAGCSVYNETEKIASHCTCGPEGPTTSLKIGTCSDSTCLQAFLLFIGISAISKFIDSSGRIGNLLVQYRCVHPSDKSLSIGITIFLLSIFAFLPSPIFFGAIIDSTCLVWDTKCNSKSLISRANCLLYDGPRLRYYFNLTAAAFAFMGVVFDTFVWRHVKNLDLYDESENIKNGYYTYINGTKIKKKDPTEVNQNQNGEVNQVAVQSLD